MSDTPQPVKLVYLVHPGQGYAPITFSRFNLPPVLPGAAFEVHPRIAAKLLAAHPGTIAALSFELPGAPASAPAENPTKE